MDLDKLKNDIKAGHLNIHKTAISLTNQFSFLTTISLGSCFLLLGCLEGCSGLECSQGCSGISCSQGCTNGWALS